MLRTYIRATHADAAVDDDERETSYRPSALMFHEKGEDVFPPDCATDSESEVRVEAAELVFGDRAQGGAG